MNEKALIMYHCPNCSRGFIKKADCEKHMKIHKNEKHIIGLYLNFEDGQWKYYTGMKRIIPSSDKPDESVEDYRFQWYTETEYTDTGIAEAKERLKKFALNALQKHIETIEKLYTGEIQ